MSELKNKILREFWVTQCDEDDGHFFDDETPCVRYSTLERELGVDKNRLKPEIHELRNDGYIILAMTVDYDGVPSGSGWMLTDKGVEKCNELFLI